MTDKHNYSFFGQKVGLIVQNSLKSDPFIFFRLLRAKDNGTWEKPSNGEGKVIKFSIEEMIWIIRVLKKDVKSWSSFHSYKDTKTPIAFKWKEGENEKLWINIGGYSKKLDYSQFTVLKMLMEHILEEKIKYATAGNMKTKTVKNESSKSQIPSDNLSVVEERINLDPTTRESNNIKTTKIKGGIIEERELALHIKLETGVDIWFPKSTIAEIDESKTTFTVVDWVLRKNKIIT